MITITEKNVRDFSMVTTVHRKQRNAGYFMRLDGTMPDEFKGCDPEEIVAEELSGTTRKIEFTIDRVIEINDKFKVKTTIPVENLKSAVFFIDEVTITEDRKRKTSFVKASNEDPKPCGLHIFKRK